MPTISGALAQVCTKIEATFPFTRLSSCLRRDLDPMTGTAKTYSVIPVGTIDERSDSNQEFRRLYLKLDVHQRINEAGGDTEEAIIEDNCLSYIETLLDPDFWRIPGTTLHLVEYPSMSISDLTRVGNVVSFSVTVALAIAP